MGRKPRIDIAGALYHVSAKTIAGEEIFTEDQAAADFVSSLTHAQKRYPFSLFAYTIMPNHFHVLLETREHSLGKVMQVLLTRFSRLYNHRHARSGHIFADRYKAVICDKSNFLTPLVNFIHANPMREKHVSSLTEWKWTSFNSYMGIKETPHPLPSQGQALTALPQGARETEIPDIDCDAVFNVLHEDKGTAREMLYKETYSQESITPTKNMAPHERFPILGDSDFIRSVLSKTNELRRREPADNLRATLEEIVLATGTQLKISPLLIKTNIKVREAVFARMVVAYIATQHSHYPAHTVARCLHLKNPSSVTYLLRRAMNPGKEFLGTVREIVHNLREGTTAVEPTFLAKMPTPSLN
ncbi:transposase [Elusimicrobiota bacterium]